MREHLRRPLVAPTLRGVHHLALCTDDMKATIDFYVEVLGMPLVHAMKVPPGLGAPVLNGGCYANAGFSRFWVKGINDLDLRHVDARSPDYDAERAADRIDG